MVGCECRGEGVLGVRVGVSVGVRAWLGVRVGVSVGVRVCWV